MNRIKKIKGTITFKALSSHPDTDNIDKVHVFSDTYIIDTYSFYSTDQYIEYIKRDLMLVASGGYETRHINVIDVDLKELK